MRYIRQNTDHQDVHIRTASSSSATASNPENVIQKILSHAYPDLPPICSRAQSLITIPATMSDYGTESDEESSSDNDAPSPSSAEHDFFNPVRQAKRVIILDRPPRNFDATHAPQQMGHLCETGTQDCRPNPSVGAEISDKAANLSLDELYGKGLTSYPHQTVIEVEMKASLLSLLSIDAFEYMLAKPETRKAFRDWLVHQGGADKLDRWTEESRINQLHMEAQQGAQQLLERYHDSDGKDSAKPNQIEKVESLDKNAITETINLAHSSQVLVASRQHLLQSLYSETFKQFITSKLLEVTKMKLRSGVDENICKGLGSFIRKCHIVACLRLLRADP